MLNAEEILLLEKKWFKYKTKSILKYISAFFILFLGVLLYYFFPLNLLQNEEKKEIPNKVVEVKEVQTPPIAVVEQKPIIIQTPIKKTELVKELNTSLRNNESLDLNKSNQNIETVIKENSIPYHLKLTPTLKTNDLFTSSSSLKFNSPYQTNGIDLKTVTTIENTQPPIKTEVPQEVQKEQVKENVIQQKQPTRTNIKISSEEIDTITYLKEKFYSTENIVFAIMLAEEFYNEKNYEESLKWSLSANEIDPKNDKSWFWFAKNKVKLSQREDAIKALKAYLSESNSSRLKTLLKQIETGEDK